MDFDPSQVKHHALYPLTDDFQLERLIARSVEVV